MKVIKHKDKWYLQSETGYKEILLSTDDLLIKDGIQAIDDEFLEWFVKNPSCEEVEVEKDYCYGNLEHFDYKIIIPKEKPKTFKELFANTGIEPTTDENGNIQYNFKATMKEEPKLKCICDSENDKWVCTRDCTNKELKQETELDAYYRNGVGGAKQETLEEFAKEFANNSAITNYEEGINVGKYQGVINGAKWQQERSYSEEEVYDIVEQAIKENSIKQLHFFDGGYSNPIYTNLKKWFEQFKKK
jgi:hypothetical protein